jgi:hypothetical protein
MSAGTKMCPSGVRSASQSGWAFAVALSGSIVNGAIQIPGIMPRSRICPAIHRIPSTVTPSTSWSGNRSFRGSQSPSTTSQPSSIRNHFIPCGRNCAAARSRFCRIRASSMLVP